MSESDPAGQKRPGTTGDRPIGRPSDDTAESPVTPTAQEHEPAVRPDQPRPGTTGTDAGERPIGRST